MTTIRPGTDADRPQTLAHIGEVFGPEPAQRADDLWDWQWHQDPRLTKSDRPQPLMVRALPAAAQGIFVTQGDGEGG